MAKKIQKARGFVVSFMDDEHRPLGIRSYAFSVRDWLVEHVAPHHDGSACSISMAMNAGLGPSHYTRALNGFIEMRGERTSYLGAIISIDHAYSKNYEWESYRVTYSSNGLVRSETCVRMYDEVLAMQLKLSIG